MSAQPGLSFVSPTDSEVVEDGDPVANVVLIIFESRGWTRVDKNGKTVPDDASAKNFVYELFRDSAVVNSEADIAEDGLSSADLYAKVFPRAPGATSDPVDDVQFEAYKSLSRKLWAWAGTGVRSHCQETVEMEGLDYVMCEKKVFRASRDGSTGTGAPRQVQVRFFTSDPDLIFALSSQPAAAKLVRAAEETSKHLAMNTKRRPELINRVAKETQSALKRSSAHLAPITDAKRATAALDAGSDA